MSLRIWTDATLCSCGLTSDLHDEVQRCDDMSDAWRKSSYSGSQANCVEVSVAPGPVNEWRKSSYSGSQAECVEVGVATSRVKVRDTKDRQGPALTVSADTWRRFMAGIKRQC